MIQLFISKDAERLPEGFRRIAYDSDTMKFTFRDSNGRLYHSEAGAEYGILTPISASSTAVSRSRPNAFSSGTVVDFSSQFNSATHPLYQIHHQYHQHPVEGRLTNKSRHSMIFYLPASSLPLLFPKRTPTVLPISVPPLLLAKNSYK